MSATWQDKTQAGRRTCLNSVSRARWPGRFAMLRVRWTPRPVILASYNMSGETGRRRGNPRETLPSPLTVASALLTLWVHRREWRHVRVPLHSHVPGASIKSPWQSQSWRQDILYGEITGPVITANKACVSRLAVPKTFNGEIRAKHAKGWLVGGATQWENDKRGVLETEVFEAGCYLTDECLSRITTSERYPNHLPKCDNRLM